MAYHGISTYQFYTTLKHVDKGSVPYTVHGNQLLEHSSMKKDLCTAWLGRICTELVEGLPTGFGKKMIFLYECKTSSWKPE
jgi:hypothetical protein